MLCAKGGLLLGLLLVAPQSLASAPDIGKSHSRVHIVDDGRAYTYKKGSGSYRVAFNYTGKNWTHADVAAIKIATHQPIAIFPMQYTEPGGMQPGAIVDEKSIGKRWNTITKKPWQSDCEIVVSLCSHRALRTMVKTYRDSRP